MKPLSCNPNQYKQYLQTCELKDNQQGYLDPHLRNLCAQAYNKYFYQASEPGFKGFFGQNTSPSLEGFEEYLQDYPDHCPPRSPMRVRFYNPAPNPAATPVPQPTNADPEEEPITDIWGLGGYGRQSLPSKNFWHTLTYNSTCALMIVGGGTLSVVGSGTELVSIGTTTPVSIPMIMGGGTLFSAGVACFANRSHILHYDVNPKIHLK